MFFVFMGSLFSRELMINEPFPLNWFKIKSALFFEFNSVLINIITLVVDTSKLKTEKKPQNFADFFLVKILMDSHNKIIKKKEMKSLFFFHFLITNDFLYFRISLMFNQQIKISKSTKFFLVFFLLMHPKNC